MDSTLPVAPVGLRLTSAEAPAISVGGILPIKPLSVLQAEEKAAAQELNAKSYVSNLAGHIRSRWAEARNEKLLVIEERLLQCLRQRRGEYDPKRLDAIRAQGGSDIYMMLSSNKARAAASWIKDVMLGSGVEKPWTIDPTKVPDLPPQRKEELVAEVATEAQYLAATGVQLTPVQLRQLAQARKEMVLEQLREEAKEAARVMENKMEDQLQEGSFYPAFSQFVDDLVTFPSAFLKGPVVRRKSRLAWLPDGSDVDTVEDLVLEWERVDPFMIYPAPQATSIDDGDLIQRHRMTRRALEELKGVEGYNEAAINAVLDEYGRGGLHEWLWVDSAKATAEGRSATGVMTNSGNLIDALQFWGSVQGKLLIEWGLDEEKDAIDPLREYEVEAWLIGSWVIKAMINPDPLRRRPYYKASYEEVPGAFWGNSPMDLIRDCQDMCNAAARALANNMGIASGPQVWINVDRLPQGEDITKLYPWKIHQTTSDPMGSTAAPIGFFQPNSLSQELMAVYERFAVLADEYSGVPRYMTGDSPAGGAGRTATGMSMLMNNAGKSIKQVIGNIDRFIMQPLLERLWYYNMRYSDDADLKGDVRVVVRGTNSLMVKDAAAQRRNEFLQMAVTNPVVTNIIGPEPIAALLREQARTLDMNADRVIPPPEVVQAKNMIAQVAQAQMAAQMQAAQPGQPGQPGQAPAKPSQEQLMDGTPVADSFAPKRQG